MLTLIFGIISIVMGGLGFSAEIGMVWSPIIGIIFGAIAFVKAKKLMQTDSKAKAGRITGLVGLIISIVAFVLGIANVAVQLYAFSIMLNGGF